MTLLSSFDTEITKLANVRATEAFRQMVINKIVLVPWLLLEAKINKVTFVSFQQNGGNQETQGLALPQWLQDTVGSTLTFHLNFSQFKYSSKHQYLTGYRMFNHNQHPPLSAGPNFFINVTDPNPKQKICRENSKKKIYVMEFFFSHVGPNLQLLWLKSRTWLLYLIFN